MKPHSSLALSVALFAAASSFGADLRDGLVAYWPMDVGVGSFPVVTPDVVGGNDLTGPDMTDTAFSTGRTGQAVTFDGAAGYLTFLTPPEADTGLPVSRKGSWTLALWVKAEPQTAGNYYYVDSSSVNPTPLTAFTARANAGGTGVYVRDAAGNNPVNMPAVSQPTLDGTWHHVAMTYDAATRAFRHYVDAIVVTTNSYTPNTANSGIIDQVTVGARNRNGALDLFFGGSVDDVAVWARALSAEEIGVVTTAGIVTPVPKFSPTIALDPQGASSLLPGDSAALEAHVYGTRPMSYQWTKDGAAIGGATQSRLQLPDLTTSDSGDYRLVVANAQGTATSAVARVTVADFVTPNLTNGLVAYWPLDSIAGVKTPDVVSAYDLTMSNMGPTNLVEGRWGNALYFDKTFSQFARRIHNAGDALPIYPKANFTVAFWAKAPPAASGWAFAESSTLGNNPAFCMGMLNNSPALDGFARTDGGQPAGDHRLSATPFWDDTWHHVAWVQHDVGGVPKAALYIDGALDPAGNLNPVYPITPNNTALASFARATPAQFFTGTLDDVVIWERPLSPAEIALLQTGPITNAPSRLSPLTVNAFRSDLPAVVAGDSITLRWDVPANATQVSIEGVGDVTSQTVSGLGNTSVVVSNTSTFVLTVKRGLEQVSASVRVAAVAEVADNWSLLDNFDTYDAGLLGQNGWWVDMYGNSVSVVTPSGDNRMAKTILEGASGAYLRLNALTVNENQSRTLFFRMMPTGTPDGVLSQVVGLTDKAAQFYYQLQDSAGPAVRVSVNDPSQNPGDWFLAARNGPLAPLTFPAEPLQVGALYSVWIDVTNVFIGERTEADLDVYSVYIQKDGQPERTLLFESFLSDRDPQLDDALTGGLPTDAISRLYLSGNSAISSALFDDFYLSKSGFNASVPRAAGYTGGGGNASIRIERDGASTRIVFEGRLQEAESVTGGWSNVAGAASPYVVPPSVTMRFYRAAGN
jgi:hypothetical protein